MTGIELIDTWVNRIGLDRQTIDPSGRACSFVYEQNLPVTIESPAYCDDLFITIEISEVGRGELRRKRLERAMQLNAYALDTRGAALGWDTVGERIILSYRTSTERTDDQALENLVTNLLDVAEQLQPLLAMKEEEMAQEKLAKDFDSMFKPIKP